MKKQRFEFTTEHESHIRFIKSQCVLFVLSGEMVFIIIIAYQNFRIRLEAIDWMPSSFISRISLQCNESLEDFMDFEDYDSYFFSFP